MGLAAIAVAAVLAFGVTSRSAAAAQASQVAGSLSIDGKTIPVFSLSAGVSNPFTVGSGGGGGGSGKASFSSLNLLMPTGAATPSLFLDVASGRHFPTAVVRVTNGTGGSAASFTYELTDVVVESAQQSGAADSLVDSVSLAFRKVKWTYTDGGGSTSRAGTSPRTHRSPSRRLRFVQKRR
jgi:type VI secretion system secreted protein Hcp